MSKPVINYDKCVGCGVCIDECAVGCITMVTVKKGGTRNTVRPCIAYDQCIDCLTCSEACPAGAIR